MKTEAEVRDWLEAWMLAAAATEPGTQRAELTVGALLALHTVLGDAAATARARAEIGRLRAGGPAEAA